MSNETKEERKARKMLLSATHTLAHVDTSITVLCVRFGNKYGSEYVERLRNMVNRHLTIPHEIVCLTDDQHPISGVRSILMLDQGYVKKWWHKIHMFDPRLPLQGRVLYLDLDLVISGSIDQLVGYEPTQFVGILDFNRKFHATWKYLNSSVMAWDHGTQSHIFSQFMSNPKDAMRLQGDQDWIWKLCRDRIVFWPTPWIQSYKWEIRSKEELVVIAGVRQFKTIKHDVVIPAGCSIAVFHGDPNPLDVKDKFVIDNWQ